MAYLLRSTPPPEELMKQEVAKTDGGNWLLVVAFFTFIDESEV